MGWNATTGRIRLAAQIYRNSLLQDNRKFFFFSLSCLFIDDCMSIRVRPVVLDPSWASIDYFLQDYNKQLHTQNF